MGKEAVRPSKSRAQPAGPPKPTEHRSLPRTIGSAPDGEPAELHGRLDGRQVHPGPYGESEFETRLVCELNHLAVVVTVRICDASRRRPREALEETLRLLNLSLHPLGLIIVEDRVITRVIANK